MGRPVTERGSRPRSAPRTAPSNRGQFRGPSNQSQFSGPRSAVPTRPAWAPRTIRPPRSAPIPSTVPRRLPISPRYLPFGWLPLALPLADGYFANNPSPVQPPSGGGWYIKRDCGRRPGAPPYIYNGGYIGPGVRYLGPKVDPGCIAGQAVGQVRLSSSSGFNDPISSSASTALIYDVGGDDTKPSSSWRGRIDLVYWRDSNGSTQPFRHYPYTVAPQPMANPNALRYSLSPPPAAPFSPDPIPMVPGGQPWQWDSGGSGPPPPPVRRP